MVAHLTQQRHTRLLSFAAEVDACKDYQNEEKGSQCVIDVFGPPYFSLCLFVVPYMYATCYMYTCTWGICDVSMP